MSIVADLRGDALAKRVVDMKSSGAKSPVGKSNSKRPLVEVIRRNVVYIGWSYIGAIGLSNIHDEEGGVRQKHGGWITTIEVCGNVWTPLAAVGTATVPDGRTRSVES